jgi:hypothetical protein
MENGAVNGDAIFELCAYLSLKEFGSLLNFLQARPMLLRDAGGRGYFVHIDI